LNHTKISLRPRRFRPKDPTLREIYSGVAFSIYVPKKEFSFLNRILMVSAKRAFISPVSARLNSFHSTNEFKIHQDAGEVK